ncbi:MAG: hypothetical protein Q8O32_03125 [bacterium]|nr:hypothetical protein [bacterium]
MLNFTANRFHFWIKLTKKKGSSWSFPFFAFLRPLSSDSQSVAILALTAQALAFDSSLDTLLSQTVSAIARKIVDHSDEQFHPLKLTALLSDDLYREIRWILKKIIHCVHLLIFQVEKSDDDQNVAVIKEISIIDGPTDSIFGQGGVAVISQLDDHQSDKLVSLALTAFSADNFNSQPRSLFEILHQEFLPFT